MTAPHSRRNPVAIATVLLLVLGIGGWALYRVLAPGEDHSYSPGATPPAYVRLTEGTTYGLAIVGGAETLQRTIPLDTLRCSYARRAEPATTLAITPEANGTKATNRIATFVAPVTGATHVECAGVAAVFVDDADGAGDASGWFLLLATIGLAIGLPLALSRARLASQDRADAPPVRTPVA